MGRIMLSGSPFEDSDLGMATSRAREVILKGNAFIKVALSHAWKPDGQTNVIEK